MPRFSMTELDRREEDPLLGSTVAGRYHIERRIGSGAMGAVYRAKQAELGRHVALKVLRRDVAWAGDTVQRFRREAQAMSALQHPNTVRVFDFGATQDGLLFLAMELLEGEPASALLVRGDDIPVRDAVVMAQEVLRSIGEAHAKGIVHRDIKPDNVFLAQVQGRHSPMVKVLDFGIAKSIEGERKINQFETLDGTVFGTPRYMSPEQAAGKSLDARTDLYSVGVLLYELLTGQPPFVDSDAVVVMAQHIREQPAALSSRVGERMIPRSLQTAVSRALQKHPDLRFQTAQEFDEALQHCLIDVDKLQRPSLARLSHAVVGSVSAQSKRQRVAMFTALGLALAVGAWALLHGHAGEEPRVSAPVRVVVPPAPAEVPPPQITPSPEPTPQTAEPAAPSGAGRAPGEEQGRPAPARNTRPKRKRATSATTSPTTPASPYEKF